MSGESPLGSSEGIISYCAICTRKGELTREAACRFLHGIRIRLAHATNGRFRKVHFAICMTGNCRKPRFPKVAESCPWSSEASDANGS